MTASKRKGDWLQTRTGIAFFPLDPRVEEVNIMDIASALSNMCRFTGHTTSFYSVAQHSVHVSEILPPELALAGLLHDAAEAYLVDVPSPLKRLPEFGFYREAEAVLQRVIFKRFGIKGSAEAPAIKEADLCMLLTEARDVMVTPDLAWLPNSARPRDARIEPWEPKEALSRFLLRFKELTQGRVS